MCNWSALGAKNDLDDGGNVQNCVAVRDMLNTKFLQKSIVLVSVLSRNFFECQYCGY